MAFDVDAYLARIHCERPAVCDAAALATLHRAHFTHVPYENLDILAGRDFDLSDDALFDKLVPRRRGGFCYELNLPFARLLRELGFAVTLLAARVMQESGVYGPEFGHPILRVDLERPWLADVANARWFSTPILLDESAEQSRDGFAYWWVAEDDGATTLWARPPAGTARPQYQFTSTPRQGLDFLETCRYNWTSPESKFTRGYLISRVTPEGRIRLENHRVTHIVDGVAAETPIADWDHFDRVLDEGFGLVRPG